MKQTTKQKKMTPKAAIFDFDFTLADSSRGILECVNGALAELGSRPPETSAIVATIGLSLPDTFRELTGDTDAALARRFTQYFHQRADQCMDSLTTVFDCVGPVLRKIRAANLRTGIVTTKLNYRINSILNANNMLDLFDVIVGADDVTKTKPDPEGLLLALRKLSVSATSAVYIGDHVIDAEAARNAGLPFIAVLTGKHQRSSFEPYPNEAIVQSVEDLPGLLLNVTLPSQEILKN